MDGSWAMAVAERKEIGVGSRADGSSPEDNRISDWKRYCCCIVESRSCLYASTGRGWGRVGGGVEAIKVYDNQGKEGKEGKERKGKTSAPVS